MQNGNSELLNVLFLGAGASKASPLNLPTTKDFLGSVQDAGMSAEERAVFTYCLTELKTDDIEKVLLYLDSLLDIRSQPANRFFAAKITLALPGWSPAWSPFINTVDSLRRRIRLLLFEEYGFERVSSEAVTTLHDGIFRAWLESGEQVCSVFTTNYDNVIETFADTEFGREFHFIDGFRAESRASKRFVWDESEFDYEGAKGPILSLHKLHGSLTWRRETGGTVVSVPVDEPARSEAYKENVLVYPGNVKDPTEYPFSYLHDRFINHLRKARTCVVIGFSFRDRALNEVFLEFTAREGTELVVVGPHAGDIIAQNLVGAGPNGTIELIEARFGEGDTSARLYELFSRQH